MITINENKLEAMINDAVNKRIESVVYKLSCQSIKDTIEHLIIGEFYEEIRNNVAKLMKNIYDGIIEANLVSIIRKRFPPNIIYVNEIKKPLPQIASFGVKEVFALPTGPCIYFLCKENRIVYIGQSINIGMRIAQHVLNKNFDRVFYMDVKKEDLNKVESELIEYYEPEYNGRLFEKNNSGHEQQRR